MAEELVLDCDFKITKAQAKINKLKREFDISKNAVLDIKNNIEKLNESLSKEEKTQQNIKDTLKEQKIEASNLALELEKVKNDSATGVRYTNSGVIKSMESELKAAESSIKNSEKDLLKSFNEHAAIEAKIKSENVKLEKQENKTENIKEQIAATAENQTALGKAIKKSNNPLESFLKRVKGLAKRVLIFSVITKALRAMRDAFAGYLKQDTKLAGSMAKLKGNLATIGATISSAIAPVLQVVIDKLVYITALAGQVFAKLLGKDVKQMAQLATNTKKVAKESEKAEKSLAGFDTLQMIDTSSNTSNSDSSAGVDTSSITGDLDITQKKLNDILWTVGEIGLGLLAWKISSTFLGQLGGLVFGAGLGLLFESIRDQLENGLTLGNTLTGMAAGALLGAAIGYKLGGGIGALVGALIGAGGITLIKGIYSMVEEGISGKNIAAVVGGALTVVLGIALAVKKFNASKAPINEFDTATETVEAANAGTSKLTGKLKSFAQNLAWGLVILAEVAAAAILFVVAVWAIGELMQKVIEAWQPVIDNAGTAAIAIGMGAALLVVVGLACAAMGGIGGGTLAAWMGIGIAILAEMSIATDLFLAEVWIIGILLQKVGEAWQPVLDNGDTIKTGIEIGTGLLIGIGVVTAALGAATVASAGLLPLAIGLGTALLVELAEALILFIQELARVADSMTYDLYPPLENLNAVLPDLSDKMKLYTAFMKKFAGYVVEYTKSSAISGFSSTVDSIVRLFTKDPIKSLSKDAEKQYKQSNTLNDNLQRANPALEKSISLMQKYYALLSLLSELTYNIKNISFATGLSKKLSDIVGDIGNLFNAKTSKYNTITRTPAMALNSPAIPKLATGMILPGGSPMLAWVNDQPKGQGYVEGSIENIAAAFDKYLGNKPMGNQNVNITFKGSLAQLAQILAPEISIENKRSSVFAKG